MYLIIANNSYIVLMYVALAFNPVNNRDFSCLNERKVNLIPI